MKNLVSVVIPVYNGEKFFLRLLKMLRRNSLFLGGCYKLEVIFVNDNPDNPIGDILNCYCDDLKVTILETESNKGIHGARVEGLRASKGDYILFLDQDDFISDNYVLSQLELLKNTDKAGVVCNATTDLYDVFYSSTEIHSWVNDIEKYYESGNKIISPGCVLLKKSEIPLNWTTNIQKMNGADDFLLWCMMLYEGKTFAINEDILYYHTPTRGISSVSLSKINDSLDEAINILNNSGYISKTKCFELKVTLLKSHREIDDTVVNNRTSILGENYDVLTRESRLDNLYRVASQWLKLKEEGTSLVDFFEYNNYKSIAIYGLGSLGDSLIKELQGTEIEIKCFIDNNVKRYWTSSMIPVVNSETKIPKVDAIVVTAVNAYEILKSKYADYNVISIDRILGWFSIR